MTVREPISKRLRFEVFKRDGFRCVYCGAVPSETVMLECDHVIPVAGGGVTTIDNLATACQPCNRGKAAVPLSVVPDSLEEKAVQMAEREAQVRAFNELMEAKKQRRDDEIWSIADLLMERFHEDTILRASLATIGRFLDELNYHEVLEAMETATVKMYSRTRAFRYFCGICWRKIRRAYGEDV